MEITDERYFPCTNGQIKYEHLHRYALCLDFAIDKSVLDIASGTGYGSALLAQIAGSVVGIDIDSEVIEYATQEYSNQHNLEFLVGSCESLPLPNNSVDLVTSFETIEHHDKHEEMMQEIKRVLKPGGVLIISSPNRITYSDAQNYSNPFHVKELYYDELVKLISSYFGCFQIYGQRLATGSFIFQLENSESSIFKAYTGNVSNIEPKISSLENPIYFIVVCSDESHSIKFNLNSVYIDRNDDLLKLMESGWHQTGQILAQTQLQLAQTQLQLEQDQSRLCQMQVEIEKLQSNLDVTQANLDIVHDRLAAMESSKFWKLRKMWFGFKFLIGLVRDFENE